MQALRRFLSAHAYDLLLTFVVVALFATNYESGTLLTGWDNLQTDLNPWLAVKRAWNAGWQEYQSLGLVSGLAHATDLLRALCMAVMSYVLPDSLERYFFQLLMLLTGGFGMMRFLDYAGFRDERRVFAFAGAVFYTLNLGTIQLFALPLEPFSVFFAALPWLVWSFLQLVDAREAAREHASRYFWSRFGLFILVNVLATPAYYIQTVFVVTMIMLAGFSAGLLLSRKAIPHSFRALGAALVIIVLNLFWLLPQFYFLSNSRAIVREAKSNTISTDDLFYQNQEKGTLESFVRFEGFYMDLTAPGKGSIFAEWKAHQAQAAVRALQIALVVVVCIGLFAVTRLHPSFLIGLAICAIALMPATPPFSLVNAALRENETLNQIFRAPFTKFIVPYAFIASFFFASGLTAITRAITFLIARYRTSARSRQGLIHRMRHRAPTEIYRELMLHTHTRHGATAFTPLRLTEDLLQHILRQMQHPEEPEERRGRFSFTAPRIVGFLAFIVIVLAALPAFRGQFFSPIMRVSPPADYAKLNDFFRKVDPQKRIGLLPEYTFWGWFFHRWGYNGSGFLWYGIEQPIMSRTFDVWSDRSEGYFWEIKAASEAEDTLRFEQTLEKYGIDYLVMDYSLIPVSASIKGLQYDRLEELLERSGRIRRVAKWKELAVYEFRRDAPVTDYVVFFRNLPNIGPAYKLTNDDTAYRNHGDYLYDPTRPYDFYYPYRDVMTQTRMPRARWSIAETDDRFTVSAEIEQELMRNLGAYDLESATESATISLLSGSGRELSFQSPIDVEFAGDKLRLGFDKYLIGRYLPENAEFVPCGQARGENRTKVSGEVLRLSSTGGANLCFQFTADSLEQRYGYIMKIGSRNLAGRSLYFYALDRTKVQSYMEDRLPGSVNYYVLSPKYENGVGYNFTFHNTSYDNAEATNELNAFEIYYMPYRDLRDVRFVRRAESGEGAAAVGAAATGVDARQLDYWRYRVTLPRKEDMNDATLTLYQSYDAGWKAYRIDPAATGIRRTLQELLPMNYGKEVGKHVLINNWANGWRVDPQLGGSTLILVFWPQYLQFAGMVLTGVILLVTGGVMIVGKLRNHNEPE